MRKGLPVVLVVSGCTSFDDAAPLPAPDPATSAPGPHGDAAVPADGRGPTPAPTGSAPPPPSTACTRFTELISGQGTQTHIDPDTGISNGGVTLSFGAELQGTTASQFSVRMDDVSISW